MDFVTPALLLLLASPPSPDPSLAGRFSDLALHCVHREYPNKIAHVLASDEDARVPRELTPAFYGCFDWHSAVHGHWMLARLARLLPESDLAPQARRALAQSLVADKIAIEVEYLRTEGRASFERPYGLAWLLQLATELREWEDPQARLWSETLAPLEDEAALRFASWLPKLAYPIRTGEHSQTAFAFGLVLDWARAAGRRDMEALLVERTRTLYLEDRDCPLGYEPSGQDFLSPCLAEADLLRRVLSQEDYATWLVRFLPQIPPDGSGGWLPVGIVTDRSDGKLAHLDGLNLSRAWMLDGIASALPDRDARRASLEAAAQRHHDDAMVNVSGEHYAGGHWLASFATYLVTSRGISDPDASSPPAPPAARQPDRAP